MGVEATIITTVLSVLAGGAITAYFSRKYYQKASKDLNATADGLREESERLKRYNILMLRAIEKLGASGTVKLNRDPKTDEPIGLEFQVGIGITSDSRADVSADPSARRSGRIASFRAWLADLFQS